MNHSIESTDGGAEEKMEADRPADDRRAQRRILAGLFLLLASLGVMVSTVALWAHQSVLDTEGWTDTVGTIASDPEVIDAAGVVVVHELSEAIDLRAVVVDVLPAGELYGGMVTALVEEVLADVISDVVASEDLRHSFAEVNRVAHEQGLAVIRGGDEILDAEDGVLVINTFPLIGALLVELQEMGIVDPDAEIPDLSEYRPPIEAITQLEAVLGTDLPDDIGTIRLIDSEQLAAAQRGVKEFDLIVLLSFVLTAVFAVVAISIANRRLRMVLWLGVGIVIAVGLARTFARAVMEAMTGAVADGPGGDTVRAVVDIAVESLSQVAVIVAVVGAAIAVIAWLVERRRQGRVEGAAPVPLSTWVRLHSLPLSVGGLVVIGLLVLSQITGPDVAIWAAAGAAVWLIGIRIIGGEDEPEVSAEPGT